MSLNPRARSIRIVIASAVGSLIWAGCATRTEVIHEPAGAEVAVFTTDGVVATPGSPVYIADLPATPIDLTKRRPDTTPERRLGLPPITFYLPGTTHSVREIYLIRSRQEIDHATSIAAGDSGAVIIERSGAPVPTVEQSVIEIAPPAPPAQEVPVAPEAVEPDTIFQNNEVPDEGPLLRLHVVKGK